MVLRRSALAAVLVLAVTLLGAATALQTASADPDPPSYSKTNRDPAFIQAYDGNVENLPTAAGSKKCQGDWRDLIYYMKFQGYSPDLFTVQQISGQAQLNQLLAFMNSTLKGQYKGVVAKPSPKRWTGTPCGAAKEYQTNAVIYRIGRFGYTPRSAVTWRSQSKYKKGPGHTKSCHDDNLDRSVNLAVPLYDKVAKQHIVAGSFHWPTANHDGQYCLNDNASQTAANVGRAATTKNAGGTVALRIVGGDANATSTKGKGKGHWLRALNGQQGGKYGYADAAYSACAGNSACLRRHWTIETNAKKRIDFLFARVVGGRGFPGITGLSTVSFESGDRADLRLSGKDDRSRSYSDHRAIKARIHYGGSPASCRPGPAPKPC